MRGYQYTRFKLQLAALLVLATGVCVPLGISFSPPRLGNAEVSHEIPIEVHARETQPILTLADFEGLLDKKLQGPSVNAKPAAPPDPPKAPAVSAPTLPTLALLATAVESDASESRAWIQMPGKPVITAEMNQRLQSIPGEPVLERIERGLVVLRFGSRPFELKLKKVENAK